MKNERKNRYHPKLFLIGFLTNILKKFPLLLAAVILAVIGINNPVCGYIALGLFILVLVWSFIQQLRIKHTVEHSDNPNFEPFAKAMMSDNWREELKDVLEGRIQEAEEKKNEE